jgi:hypothetical protein
MLSNLHISASAAVVASESPLYPEHASASQRAHFSPQDACEALRTMSHRLSSSCDDSQRQISGLSRSQLSTEPYMSHISPPRSRGNCPYPCFGFAFARTSPQRRHCRICGQQSMISVADTSIEDPFTITSLASSTYQWALLKLCSLTCQPLSERIFCQTYTSRRLHSL